MSDQKITDPSVIYVGSTSDSDVSHWGGTPRRASVVGRPLLARGDRAWLVELDEPIPGSDGSMLRSVILADRLTGYSIEDLRPTPSSEPGPGWVPVHVARVRNPAAIERGPLAGDDLVNEFWGEAALLLENLPKVTDPRTAWERDRGRIERYIQEHGDSQFPSPYFDADGRLDVVVENIRWHHAGKAGISPGPYPGIDYAADLDRVEGWEW